MGDDAPGERTERLAPGERTGRLATGAWLLAGALVITAGAGTAGIYAFRGRVELVALGFLLFFFGYRLSQAGVHGGRGAVAPRRVAKQLRALGPLQLVCLGVGLFGIALGVTLFSRTIVDPSATRAVVSGVASIGGYMFAHVGMNGSLL